MTNLADRGTLATRLTTLQQAVKRAADGRVQSGPMPTLIGASKTQPEPVLRAALAAGLRHFGENKLQEAEAKWPVLKAAFPEITLHMIGGLQSNKAAAAVALFDVIHTVDRAKIAEAIAAEAAKQRRAVQVLIQVNTGEELQKGGVVPRDAPALIAHCRALDMDLVGLMAVPPAEANPAPHFALMKSMADAHGLTWLSMGMSSDYETAIRLGATHIRVGTALFGERHA